MPADAKANTSAATKIIDDRAESAAKGKSHPSRPTGGIHALGRRAPDPFGRDVRDVKIRRGEDGQWKKCIPRHIGQWVVAVRDSTGIVHYGN